MSLMIRNRETNTAPYLIHSNGGIGSPLWKYLLDTFKRHKAPNRVKMPEDMSIVTWNTKEKDSTLEQSLASILSAPDNTFILGSGIKEWDRHQLKLTLDFLEECDTKYVLALDAFDILMIDDPGKILETYKSIYADYSLVYGAETNFWPDWYDERVKKHEDSEAHCRGVTSQWKYLNSGCVIGETAFMKEWMLSCMDQIGKEKGCKNDEQGLAKLAWADECNPLRTKVTLDYGCNLFQNLFGMNGSELEMIETVNRVVTKVC